MLCTRFSTQLARTAELPTSFPDIARLPYPRGRLRCSIAFGSPSSFLRFPAVCCGKKTPACSCLPFTAPVSTVKTNTCARFSIQLSTLLSPSSHHLPQLLNQPSWIGISIWTTWPRASRLRRHQSPTTRWVAPMPDTFELHFADQIPPHRILHPLPPNLPTPSASIRKAQPWSGTRSTFADWII